MFEEHTSTQDPRSETPTSLSLQIRALIKEERWYTLGHLCDFKPEFRSLGGKLIFDWRCIPKWVEAEFAKARNHVEPTKETNRARKRGQRRTADKFNNKSDRDTLYEFQQGFCYFCGDLVEFHQFTIDHLTPRSRGGWNNLSNKVGACYDCNHEKANKNEQEFLASGYARLRDGPHRVRPEVPVHLSAQNYKPPRLSDVTGWPEVQK